MNKQEFEAVIEKPPKTPGAYIVIPFDVREVYGTKGRVQVKAAFDGHPYRGSLAPMGGRHVLGVRKDIQQAIGKTHGNRVKVVIEQDTEPRVVTVPKDLQKLIQNMGYNITSLLAGLGLGGLAVALAAQDTLSNVFGAIAIFVDQPFRVGEQVQLEGFSGFGNV